MHPLSTRCVINSLRPSTYRMIALAMCSSVMISCTHTIKWTPSQSSSVGVLVDYTVDGDSVNDQKFYGSGSGADISAVAGMGQAVLFPTDPSFGPTLKRDINWDEETTPVVALKSRRLLKANIYITYRPGTIEEAEAKAQQMVIASNAIWLDEHSGIAIDMDALHIEDVSTLGFDSSFDVSCISAPATKAAVGADASRLNIFVYHTVGGNPDYGQACVNDNFIAVAYASRDHILAHEIGHQLANQHFDDECSTEFDQPGYSTNVMQGHALDRTDLTESQSFRAQFSEYSIVNELEKDGGGTPDTVNCDDDDASPYDVPKCNVSLWEPTVIP